MDIRETQERKLAMEAAILHALTDFEQQTGTTVNQVEVNRVRVMYNGGIEQHVLMSVKTEVHL